MGPGKPTRTVDLRPLIETIEFGDGVLTMRLRFVEQRTVRPAELLTELGLAAEKYGHLLRRVEVQWDSQIADAPTAGSDP